MIHSFRLPAMFAALLLPLMAQPALAAPNLVISNSDKIELVRDLPNDDVFEHDGQYYDLGYLYSTERVNGADVARSGSGFVLYHDDRYIQLDADKLAMLSDELGEDPTKSYIPPAKTSSGTPIAADSSSYPPTSSSAAAAAPYRSTRENSGGASWLFAIVVFLFLGAVRRIRDAAVRSVLGWAFGKRRTARRAIAIDHGDPFEDRLATRLAELNSGNPAPASQTYQPQTASVARGFGRKGL